MESFFLAETTKYLYLLFDPDNFIHNNGSCGELIQMSGGNCVVGAGGYVFNTEAHPIDIGAVYCCSARHHDHRLSLYEFQRNMDLHSLLEIRDGKNFFKTFHGTKKHAFKLKNNEYKFESTDISALKDRNVSNNASKENFLTNTTVHSNSTYKINEEFKKNFDISNITSFSDLLATLNRIQLSEDDTVPFKNSLNTSLHSNMSSLEDLNITTVINSESELNPVEQESISVTENILTNNRLDKEIFDVPDDALDSPPNSQVFEGTATNSSFSEVHPPAMTHETPNSTVTFVSPKKPVQEPQNELFDKEFYKYELLVCPAQPFTARLNRMGEMFHV
ncbi:ER degradation-enhancing alpha-mannosidase-like protein 2 [Caerostris extrusa]|uniref:ER degradation-enhancing alpha-mannosidase-like protein 2 n=1 Tax=Caerostris extrusa TaxID=172846 RepID=A0AAV4UD69_CAEEX|nr:ER degradation-enhancing alpha-mannosidase-like protein 2 [Caerostris extrusa]